MLAGSSIVQRACTGIAIVSTRNGGAPGSVFGDGASKPQTEPGAKRKCVIARPDPNPVDESCRWTWLKSCTSGVPAHWRSSIAVVCASSASIGADSPPSTCHRKGIFQSSGRDGVSTRTEITSAQKPTSCTTKPAACPNSHRFRRRIQAAGTDEGEDRNVSATSAFTGATTASQIANAARRNRAPAKVHRKDACRLRTTNTSTPDSAIEPS